MDKIVYILGAGFSRPLGLPLMNDFLQKANFLSRTFPQYQYMKNITDKLFSHDRTSRYYEFGSNNIEEAFSILEMKRHLNGESDWQEYIKFLSDVIEYYTPSIPSHDKSVINESNWLEKIFGDSNWRHYGFFICSLLNIGLRFQSLQQFGRDTHHIDIIDTPDTDTSYSIVSLNYDMVFENMCDYINRTYRTERSDMYFSIAGIDSSDNITRPILCKLHGSIKEKNLIPPTVNKGLFQQKMPVSWTIAYNSIMKANQIRIIGYSLPQTDAYIKYLLKAAASESTELERIDIICKDDDGIVKNKYDNFISNNFRNNYNFKNINTIEYLSLISQFRPISDVPAEYYFNKLEQAHERVFGIRS